MRVGSRAVEPGRQVDLLGILQQIEAIPCPG